MAFARPGDEIWSPGMKVCAVPLVEGVSLTLTDEGDGWRFSAWSRFDGRLLPPPTLVDKSRRFDTDGDAAKFFREHYGWAVALKDN